MPEDSSPPSRDRTSLPAAPSSPPELAEWIEATRELLRGQEDKPIGSSGLVHLPVAAPPDSNKPTHETCRLHRASFAYTVRERFLEHLERLFPTWPDLCLEFQPERFRTVRQLVVMMVSVQKRIGGKRKRGKGQCGPKGPRYEAKEDKRVYDGWKASGEKTIEAYAQKEYGANTSQEIRKIRLAIGRNKKRQQRKGRK